MKNILPVLIALFLANLAVAGGASETESTTIAPSASTQTESDGAAFEFLNDRIEEEVRYRLNKPQGAIFASELAQITELVIDDLRDSSSGVTELDDLRSFSALEKLAIHQSDIYDDALSLSPLAEVSTLKELNILGISVKDEEALLNLPLLEKIYTDDISFSIEAFYNHPKIRLFASKDFIRIRAMPKEPLKNDFEITWRDEDFEQWVRVFFSTLPQEPVALGKPIMKSDVLRVTMLNFSELWNTKVFFDLIHFENLEELDLSNLANADIAVLPQLKNLRSFSLNSLFYYKDEQALLQLLSKLTTLEELHLNDIRLSDLSFLTSYRNLRVLELASNDFSSSDLELIGSLRNLEVLNISDNNISDITPLEKLVKLTDLNVSKNKISSLLPLYRMRNVVSLDVSQNKISSISVLENMPNLKSLSVSKNEIESASVLARLPKLTSLSVTQNYIDSLEVVFTLKNLIHFEFMGNPISDSERKKLLALPNIEVVWQDGVIERKVRLAIGKPRGTILQEELGAVTELDLESTVHKMHIQSIDDLEKLSALSKLSLKAGRISNVKPLEYLPLTDLYLTCPGGGYYDAGPSILEDISPLENVKTLEKLSLVYVSVRNLEPLADLSNLEYFYYGNEYTPSIRDEIDFTPVRHVKTLVIE